MQGQPLHLDQKHTSYLQCEIVVHPRPEGCLRLGLLLSFCPATTKAVRNGLVALVTRNSQKESGQLHPVGPKARPVPSNVLGGPVLTAAVAREASETDLLAHARKLQPYLRRHAEALAKKRVAEDSQVSLPSNPLDGSP